MERLVIDKYGNNCWDYTGTVKGVVIEWDCIPNDSNYLMEEKVSNPPRKIKCECGSEKAGSNKHSSWCPKGNK
jgi:hypothetical protein